MVEAAICDGDWVVVRQQNAANGDIVAPRSMQRPTVKTFKRAGGQVVDAAQLRPSIPSRATTRRCWARSSR